MLEREGLKRPLALYFAGLLLLFVAGSVWDLSISTFLFTPKKSFLSRAAGAFGELPAQTLMSAAGAVWIMRRGRSSRVLEWFSIVGGVSLIAFSAGVFISEMIENFPQFTFFDAAFLSLAVILSSCVCGLLLTRQVSRSDCFRFIFTVIFVCVGAMLVVHIVKNLFHRPRMRLLFEVPGLQFIPWWKAGSFDGSALTGAAVSATDLRSFPSGHTVTAAGSILWTLLPVLHGRFEGRGRLFFLASFGWTAIVAVSRLTEGAHFLTDVVMSCIVVCVFYYAAVKLFYRNGKCFLTLYKWLT